MKLGDILIVPGHLQSRQHFIQINIIPEYPYMHALRRNLKMPGDLFALKSTDYFASFFLQICCVFELESFIDYIVFCVV